MADIPGRPVNLVEFSVPHYLLARGLNSVGLTERDISIASTADPDMAGAFQTPDVTAMATWNPMASEIAGAARRNRGLRQRADPRRDHRPDGRQHRGAGGQSRLRQDPGGEPV